jgi:hypothetical protein
MPSGRSCLSALGQRGCAQLGWSAISPLTASLPAGTSNCTICVQQLPHAACGSWQAQAAAVAIRTSGCFCNSLSGRMGKARYAQLQPRRGTHKTCTCSCPLGELPSQHEHLPAGNHWWLQLAEDHMTLPRASQDSKPACPKLLGAVAGLQREAACMLVDGIVCNMPGRWCGVEPCLSISAWPRLAGWL